jgi:hypothetical protein
VAGGVLEVLSDSTNIVYGFFPSDNCVVLTLNHFLSTKKKNNTKTFNNRVDIR